jgi:hypothetical protein
MLGDLAVRAPQRRFQSFSFLVPAVIFGLRSLLESLRLSLDACGPLHMLSLRLVQSRLCLVDRLLPAFTLLLPGGLFLCAFTLTALPLPFEGETSLPLCYPVDGMGVRPLRLAVFYLADGFGRSSTARNISGQFGMLAEGSAGSDRAPENNARLFHCRSDDVRVVAFLCRALMEKIAVGAPRFQSSFHGRSGNRQIEEAQRGLVGL